MTTGQLFADQDRVALITGAASGIGLATVKRLIDAGIGGLALIDRDEAALQALAKALPMAPEHVLYRVHDVADETAWEQTAQAVDRHFGRLDQAVVNAGVADGGAIVDYSLAAWREVMSVNLDGAFLTLKHSMASMREAGRGGAIVVVASAAALRAEAGTAAYAASKAGALQLARVAAKEGAPHRIRVNSILPGGVKTPIWRAVPLFQELVAEEGSEEAAFAAMAAMATPLGRYASAAEIAGQIALLLADDAAAMTGAAIAIDGGYSL